MIGTIPLQQSMPTPTQAPALREAPPSYSRTEVGPSGSSGLQLTSIHEGPLQQYMSTLAPTAFITYNQSVVEPSASSALDQYTSIHQFSSVHKYT